MSPVKESGVNPEAEKQPDSLIESEHRWVIILAGGKGERMRPAITSWLGTPLPKQYCTFVGTRSMLRHTWDRALRLARDDRIFTVIDRSHRRFLQRENHQALPGLILEQPSGRSTGPGILFPATYILGRDPCATVLILPSDHFIYPEERFLTIAKQAVNLAESYPDRLILLGAEPDEAETDYGWIRPGRGLGPLSLQTNVRQIQCFLEKPSLEKAKEYMNSGCYWSTFIMAARIDFLWSLGETYLPSIVKRFEVLGQILRGIWNGRADPELEKLTLDVIYESLPSADFSRDLLQPARKELLVLPMEGVEWSDWGRPARVSRSLAHLGKRNAFDLPPEETGERVPRSQIVWPVDPVRLPVSFGEETNR